MAILNTSGTIWKSLGGVICVYKPKEVSVRRLRDILINKIVTELNYLDKQIRYHRYIGLADETNSDIVNIAESNVSVSKEVDFSCHESVISPKYTGETLLVSWSNYLGWNTSGVLVFGLRGGTQTAKFIRENIPTRCYQIKGVLGKATDTGFANSKVIEKSTWRHIKQFHLDRILSSMQAAHQKKMYEMCGVDMQSELAYELAIKGPIRPSNSKIPIVYGMKCVDFIGPEFTLEIQCVNEYETYIALLIREIGLKLHSTAHCTSVKCIRHSCFSLEHTLLMKHWNLENIISNMALCSKILYNNQQLLSQENVILSKKSLDSNYS